MLPSVRAFLSEIIDYAGLFPPAKLPMESALRNYLEYRSGPEGWMLGRFVCPSVRLDELETSLGERTTADGPLRLSVLGRGGESLAHFLENLRADREAIENLETRHSNRVVVEALEARLPAAERLPSSAEELATYFQEAERLLGTARPIAYEVPSDPGRPETVIRIAHGLRGRGGAGLKIRCGGLDAAAVPTVDQVVANLLACRDAGLPLKATAGLHQPFRHHDAALGTNPHGFLNLFGAGVLAHARRIGDAHVREILIDEDPTSFQFTADGFNWKELRATVNEIHEARRKTITSFGSCSFEEPRDALRALGWLP